jgi:nucleotide-binding universal stress UspA family protein
MNAADINVKYETLLGEAYVEITHAVQQEGYDLVLAGSQGHTKWEEVFVGSTAKQLIRKCPASVWIVKAEHADPPKVILAPTDFSDVSRKAVLEGLLIAEKANADFHLLHVIDSREITESTASTPSPANTIRQETNEIAAQRLEEFIGTLGIDHSRVCTHISSGTPWKVIQDRVQELKVDLIAMGTVGRSGIQGLFLGNTAEKVLATCDCSILTTKPDGFVSPIDPATWPLHPDPLDS